MRVWCDLRLGSVKRYEVEGRFRLRKGALKPKFVRSQGVSVGFAALHPPIGALLICCQRYNSAGMSSSGFGTGMVRKLAGMIFGVRGFSAGRTAATSVRAKGGRFGNGVSAKPRSLA